MDAFEILAENLPAIQEQIGYSFKNKELLFTAFVHRSFVNEHPGLIPNNERLEFLGDAVLGVLISDFLFRKCPDRPEGDLSFLRSRLVEAPSCAQYIQKMQVDKWVLLSKGERSNDGKGRVTILADLFEAIIGAIYLDGGIEAAREFLNRNFTEEIHSILTAPTKNWKAMLQDICQKQFQEGPKYTVVDSSGPEHNKVFTIEVTHQDKFLGKGTGSSKKEAQQAAAQDAIERFFLP